MATHKTTLKKIAHNKEGAKMVETLLSDDSITMVEAGDCINTILTEALTQKEVKAILTKVVNRNNGWRKQVEETLTTISKYK